MGKQNVIAIFDIGRTNKKLFLFDDNNKVLLEESEKLEETKDEDGFPCEDLQTLTKWVLDNFKKISSSSDYNLIALNFSAYGASLVHLDDRYKPLTPLYSYLKSYPSNLNEQFYDRYGEENLIAKETASPMLGSLNSGMQLYRLKYEQPEVFSRIKYSLHLPQYIAQLVSSRVFSDITSIGCHTRLWDFKEMKYHRWVFSEELHTKFAPVCKGNKTLGISSNGRNIITGTGLHDSSAALIPYLKSFREPFILLSTGTWCISLNPFNDSLLTDSELKNDCLCYLSYHGTPVKASRLFAGYEHEKQIKRLSDHFQKEDNYYKTVVFDSTLSNKLHNLNVHSKSKGDTAMVRQSAFGERSLDNFKTYEEAYHQLMQDIMVQQIRSTKLVFSEKPVEKIFVDGGFAKNDVYMHLLASSFPNLKVYAANVLQASALGAALALQDSLSKYRFHSEMIGLKYFDFK